MPQADDDDEASPSKVTGQRVAKGLSSFGSALRKGLREWNEIQLGMSLDQARKQLLDIQQAGGLDKFIEAMKGKGRGATIRTADKMKDAKRALAIDSMLGTALPVLMEMGSLVYDVVQEASQAEKKRKRRLELRTRIRRAVDALVQAELRAWRDEVLEPLRTEMEKQQAAHADAGAGHAGQLALFKGHIERLNGLGAEITEVLTER